MLRAFEGAGPDYYGTGHIDLTEARSVFDAVMTRVDKLADRPRPLRQRQWKEVYRAANDSFAALSIQLDARDRDQAKELEAAHRRLRVSLGNLRVRGGKFRFQAD